MTTVFSNIHLAYAFAIVTVSSIVIFLAIWFLLNVFYSRAMIKWSSLNRFIEKTRVKGNSPLIRKYGLIGLALIMAIPLPTIGVYGGTLLSWLMGMKWQGSLIAVVAGATVSNSIVLLSVYGILQVTGLFV